MLTQLQSLQERLKASKTQGRSYIVLSFIVDEMLQRSAVESMTFEADGILKSCGTAKEKDQEARIWMPKLLPLTNALKVLQQDLPQPHIRLGYAKGGGRSNPSQYWLELDDAPIEQSTEDEDHPDSTSSTVDYRRTNQGEIRTSWFGRLMLRDGQFWNRSKRGLVTIFSMFLAPAVWFGMYLATLYACVGSGESVTFTRLALVAALTLGYWLVWKDMFRPWYRLVYDCVVMAPQLLVSIKEDDCQLEMYRTPNNERWTRLVRFSADCPVCGSTIELRPGAPEHRLPIVGRCKESPYAHVYSFDPVKLKGVFIGPA
jgi:hypothetical protein